MGTSVRCPRCGQRYAVGPETVGREVQCRSCGTAFVIPAHVPPQAPKPQAPKPQPKSLLDESLPPLPGFGDLPLDAGAAPDPFASGGPLLTSSSSRRWQRRNTIRNLKLAGLLVGALGVAAGCVVGLVFLVKAAWVNMPSFRSLPGEGVVQEMLSFVTEFSDTLARVKDVSSARNALPSLKAFRARAQDMEKKVEAAKRLRVTREEDRALEEKYRAKLEAAVERMVQEARRVRSIPGVPQVLAEAGLAGFRSPFGGPVSFDFSSLPPMPGGMPGTPPLTPNMARPAAPPEDPYQKLIKDHGAERVVTLSVENVPGAQTSFVSAKIREATGVVGVVRSTAGGTITVSAAPVSDLQAVAARIDFGQVTKIDPASRTITVKADPARFPEPLRDEAKNPAHSDYYQLNLAELKSPDPNRRRGAAERLRMAEPKELREEVSRGLLALMRDNDPESRRESVGAWIVWRTAETAADGAKMLLTLVRDPNALVRMAAFQALGELKDARAAEPIASLLLDKSARGDAAECLVKMGPVAEKCVLERFLGQDKEVRSEAARILEKIATNDSTGALCKCLSGTDEELARAALRILERLKDPQVIDALTPLLSHKTLGGDAARVLMQMGPAAEKAVLPLVEATDKETARQAIAMLERIGTKECVPAAIKATLHSEAGVSWAAFRILERLKDERAIVPMAELLASPHHRHSAAGVLKAIGPAAEDTILKGLKHPNRDVMTECIKLLGEMGTEKSLKPLGPLARHRDMWVRRAAQEAGSAIALRAGITFGGFGTGEGEGPAKAEPLQKGGFDTGADQQPKPAKARSTVIE